MSFTVYIRNNVTGEIRPYKDDLQFIDYMWSEGNYSCDCNRHAFFTNHEDEEIHPCGESAYSIVDVVLDDFVSIKDVKERNRFMEYIHLEQR